MLRCIPACQVVIRLSGSGRSVPDQFLSGQESVAICSHLNDPHAGEACRILTRAEATGHRIARAPAASNQAKRHSQQREVHVPLLPQSPYSCLLR